MWAWSLYIWNAKKSMAQLVASKKNVNGVIPITMKSGISTPLNVLYASLRIELTRN